jgi:hypothetical protein
MPRGEIHVRRSTWVLICAQSLLFRTVQDQRIQGQESQCPQSLGLDGSGDGDGDDNNNNGVRKRPMMLSRMDLAARIVS